MPGLESFIEKIINNHIDRNVSLSDTDIDITDLKPREVLETMQEELEDDKEAIFDSRTLSRMITEAIMSKSLRFQSGADYSKSQYCKECQRSFGSWIGQGAPIEEETISSNGNEIVVLGDLK